MPVSRKMTGIAKSITKSFLLCFTPINQSGSFPQNWSGDGEGEWRTYGAVVEVEEGRAEELGPLPEDLLGPRAVVGRRRVVEGRHLRGRGGAILHRGRRGDGRGEAGVGPGGGERGPEEPPGGGEALHARRFSLARRGRAGGRPHGVGRGACASCWLMLAEATATEAYK